MTRLKIRKIGNSLGVVLPKDVLARHKVGQGDILILSDTAEGFRLEVYDESVAEQVDAGREVARRYRNTLRELAK